MTVSDENEIVIYESNDGLVRVDVTLDGDTVWLSLDQLAQLFGRDKSTISRHIKNIYAEGELDQEATVAKNATVQTEGNRQVRREIAYYNLDAILSVGYRVNSRQATAFRQWATRVLKEYLVKGFALDDDRLKGNGGGSYWRELLDRIRDIRSSEKVLYRQVLDLYATAVDYDPRANESTRFFKTVQNKLHFSAHGQTAAEVIFNRADADEPFMGLQTFKGRQVTLADARIAKNYLNEDELKRLSVLVSAYFYAAEFRAMSHIPTYMADFLDQLDAVLKAATGADVLQNAGSVSHAKAMEKAEGEYRKYQKRTLAPVEMAYLEQLKEEAKALSECNAKRRG